MPCGGSFGLYYCFLRALIGLVVLLFSFILFITACLRIYASLYSFSSATAFYKGYDSYPPFEALRRSLTIFW